MVLEIVIFQYVLSFLRCRAQRCLFNVIVVTARENLAGGGLVLVYELDDTINTYRFVGESIDEDICGVHIFEI